MTEIQKKDFSKRILRDCKEIEIILKKLELQKNNPSKDRCQVDRQLVRFHIRVNRTYRLAFPAISSGEIHGLPEHMTAGSFDPKPTVINRRKKEWDFLPWFREKTSGLQKAKDRIFENWESEKEDTRAQKESKKSLLSFNLLDAKQFTESLIELIGSGDLKIVEVRSMK